MANPILQFVDNPASTANLRYDFNSATANCRTLALGGDGLDLGNPSYDGEPEGVGGRYGYRSLRLTQRIIGSKTVALARMSTLSKELLRKDNWLRVQLAPDRTAVYFKTYRTEPGAMSMEWSEAADAWDVTVPLVADPFAYGPRQTIATAQVVQGPTDLTGPVRTAMRVVLPTIKGEAPTPLRVTFLPANASGINSSWMVGCTSGSAAVSDYLQDIGTGDGLTAGAGTGAAVTDANFFSGSYRLVTVSAGSNLLTRLSGGGPLSPFGRFKVMLRCELDGSTTVDKPYTFAFGVGGSTFLNYGPSTRVTVPLRATTANIWRGWVDLGDFTFPSPATISLDLFNLITTNLQSLIGLKIGTADSTAGTARIDSLKFVPVDGPNVTAARFLKASFGPNDLPPSSAPVTFDADTETAWSMTSPGLLQGGAPVLKGAFLMADPNAALNLLTVMATAHGDGFVATAASSVTSLNAQNSVDVSYYPRYLYVGDGT